MITISIKKNNLSKNIWPFLRERSHSSATQYLQCKKINTTYIFSCTGIVRL